MILEIGEAELPPHMRALVALWHAKAAGRSWPTRRDLLFEDLIPWLGRLHVVEVLDDDFRFAVFGTATMGVMRREYTGLRISEIDEPAARLWETGYRDAVAGRRPRYFNHMTDTYMPGEEPFGWWRAILPLGTGETVEHLLVLIQVYRQDGSFI